MRTKRGPTKKLEDNIRYRIEEVAADGEPIAPIDVRQKFVKQCGVVVRDYVPITIREWNKPRDPEVSYIGPVGKKCLFEKVMVNFTLPLPKVDPEEGEPDEEEMAAQKKL